MGTKAWHQKLTRLKKDTRLKSATNLSAIGIFNVFHLILNSGSQPGPPVLLLPDLFKVDGAVVKKQHRYVDVLDKTSTSFFTSHDPHASSSSTALVITVLVVIIVISNVLHN